MLKETELTFRREDFEEIYFRDNQGSFFLGRSTRTPIIGLLILLLLFAISWAVQIQALVVITGSGSVMALIYWLWACKLIFAYKRSVSKSLDREGQYENYRVVISDRSLTMIQDDKEVIEQWDSFSSATIEDRYIFLIGRENFMFPKKSFNEPDYEILRETVSKNLK